MMNKYQIQNRINKLKNEIAILEEVLNEESSYINGRPLGSTAYQEEEIQFLKENKNLPMEELINKFNKSFNRDIPLSSRALYNLMVRQGLISPKFRINEYKKRSQVSIELAKETRENKFLNKIGVNKK